MKTQPEQTVIVVGGGLAGLASAMFLAQRGVKTVLVERHAGSSPHPRAVGFTTRTIELLRSVGLDSRVPQIRGPHKLRRARVQSLAGDWFEEIPWATEERSPIEFSPVSGAAIAQDGLEPLLREKAIELGADVRMQTELLNFEQDANGVTAFLRERATGREYSLRGAYLIAADGHRSPIRETLGIGREGRGHIRTVRSVLFRASLDQYLEKGVRQFNIDQPGLKAFLTTYGDGRCRGRHGDTATTSENSWYHPYRQARCARALRRRGSRCVHGRRGSGVRSSCGAPSVWVSSAAPSFQSTCRRFVLQSNGRRFHSSLEHAP